MTDGIKEFTVHVGETAGINKYMKKQNITAYITVEGENTITSYYY
jgi:hypothetical protein